MEGPSRCLPPSMRAWTRSGIGPLRPGGRDDAGGAEVVSEPAALGAAVTSWTGAVSCVGTGFENLWRDSGRPGRCADAKPGAFPGGPPTCCLWHARPGLRVRRCQLSKPPPSICVDKVT